MKYCCKKEQNKIEQTSEHYTIKIEYKQHAKQWQYITSIDARYNGNFLS